MIKHFIISRYFIIDDVYGDEMYTYEFLYSWFDIFKSNMISSLNNLKCKNFELIILIHNKVNYKTVSFFNNLNTDYKITVIHRNELESYLESFYDKFDYIIESRMDFDDFIFSDAIDDIQKQINENTSIKLYGYCSGYTYFLKDKNWYNFDISEINKNGHWSICSSLIYSTKFLNDKKHINIYSFNHGKSKIGLKNWCKENEVEWNDDMFFQNNNIKAFIYYRPENSYSAMIMRKNNKDYILPKYTNNKIEKPDNIKEIFGFKL